MNSIKFLVRGPLFYKDAMQFLGLLHAAKTSALQYNPNTRQILIRLVAPSSDSSDQELILIRADAHETTFNTLTGEVVDDDSHYTLDIKDANMVKNKTHQTIHGYVAPFTETLNNMLVVDRVVHKKRSPTDTTARVEKDLWYHDEKHRWINNWDKALNKGLREIDEPAALRDVELGQAFMAVDTKWFEELKALCDVEEAMKESIKVAKEVQGDLTMLMQQKQAKK